jgi:hypothetical protein
LPGVVLVMITLPLDTGMDRTNDVMTQPIPGSSAPLTEPMAQAASTQVSRMTAQHTSAATGTGLGSRPYWKLPIMASTTPSRNSTAYAPTTTGHSGPRPPVVPPVVESMAAGYWLNRSVSRPASPGGPVSSV